MAFGQRPSFQCSTWGHSARRDHRRVRPPRRRRDAVDHESRRRDCSTVPSLRSRSSPADADLFGGRSCGGVAPGAPMVLVRSRPFALATGPIRGRSPATGSRKPLGRQPLSTRCQHRCDPHPLPRLDRFRGCWCESGRDRRRSWASGRGRRTRMPALAMRRAPTRATGGGPAPPTGGDGWGSLGAQPDGVRAVPYVRVVSGRRPCQCLCRVAASWTPSPIMASPPTVPRRLSRCGDPANQLRAVPAAKPHAESDTRAMPTNTRPRA